MSVVLEHVRQRAENDCAVACIAMLTGKPLHICSTQVVAYGLGNPWDLRPEIVRRYLELEGWYSRAVLSPEANGGPWPPEPFAAVHWALVQRTQGSPGHAVVMDALGTVLDPNRGPDDELTLEDFEIVSTVYGLIPPRIR